MSSDPEFKIEKTTALPIWHEPRFFSAGGFFGGRKTERLVLTQGDSTDKMLSIACKVDPFFSCSLTEIFTQPKNRKYLPIQHTTNKKVQQVYLNVNSLVHRLGLKEQEVREAYVKGDLETVVKRTFLSTRQFMVEKFTFQETAEKIQLVKLKGELLALFLKDEKTKLEEEIKNVDSLANLKSYVGEILIDKKIDKKILQKIKEIEAKCNLEFSDEVDASDIFNEGYASESFEDRVYKVCNFYLNYNKERMKDNELVSFPGGYLQKKGKDIHPIMLGELLGKGGFGKVYVIHNLVNKEIKAIKVPFGTISEKLLKQLKEEAEAVEEIIPNVIEAKCPGETQQVALRIMPLHHDKDYRIIDGYDKKLERQSSSFDLKKNLPQIIKEFISLVEHFQEIQKKGFIPLDIKCENLVFTDPGAAKIIDLEYLGKKDGNEANRTIIFTPFTNEKEDLSLLYSSAGRLSSDSMEKIAVFQMGTAFYELLGFCDLPYELAEKDRRKVQEITEKGKAKLKEKLEGKLGENHDLTNLLLQMLNEQTNRISMEKVLENLKLIQTQIVGNES